MSNRKNNLIETMKIQTTSYDVRRMNEFIKNEVSKIKGCTIFKDNGNLYVTKGESDIYPCIVSHTDTVHNIVDNFQIFESQGRMFSIDGDTMKRTGIGGDDKVGVFIALQILRELPVCKAAFFRDEEVGCVGSKVAKMSFFDNVSMALQCDRKGYRDFVSNIFGCELYSKDFREVIQESLLRYGRKETEGGLTDVLQLADNGLKVACANMSCGYYDPHSDNEYIVTHEVMLTLDFVIEMFNNFGDYKWSIDLNDRYKNHNFNRGGYHSFGGGYIDPIEDNIEDNEFYEKYGYYPEDETPDQRGQKLEGKMCKDCGSIQDIYYDDYVNMHFCISCSDYKDKKSIVSYEEDRKTFLDYMEEDSFNPNKE